MIKQTIHQRTGYSVPTLALFGILALAAVLRIIGSNSEFWFDEIATVINCVRPPALQTVTHYGGANNHVMNSLLAHAAAAIWAEQPWVIRLPSILFGIAGVWAFYFLAVQIWERQIALLGTFMFAVSYHHVYYTENARGYSSFLFFALLSNALLLRLIGNDVARPLRKSEGFLYAISVGLGIYALLLMFFVILAQGCTLLWTKRWRQLGWLLAGTLFGLTLYAPMAPSVVRYFSEHPSYTGQPLFSAAFESEIRPVLIPLLAVSVVAPILMWRLARRQLAAASLLFLPLVFTVLVPILRHQGVHPRSFIYGLPIAYFLLMEGIDWVRPRFRWVPWITVAAVTVVSLVMLARYYPLPKQAFQQALKYVATHRGSTDGRIGLSMGGKAAQFYDPTWQLIEDSTQLEQWLKTADRPTWVMFTFENSLRHESPELFQWLMTSTTYQASFRGVIGDGTVYVRLWLPPRHEGARPSDPDDAQQASSGKRQNFASEIAHFPILRRALATSLQPACAWESH